MARLPMTAIVIIAIVALVLAVVAAFFISTGGGAAGRQELERQFSLGCFSVCGRPDRTEINLAASFPEWAQACEQLYSVQGAYLQCLDRCGAGCLKPLEPCEYLCAFRSLVTDFDAFCSEIKTGSNTAGTYGSCDCSCPQ